MNFRDFLIERVDNTGNEADIVLHQIVHNADEAHIDYADGRLDFNIGIMTKRSSYSDLYMTIIRDSKESVELGKNNKKDGFTIVIQTTSFPKREKIDTFLSNKGVYDKVKKQLQLFIQEYYDDSSEFETEYESDKDVNSPRSFEKMYNNVVNDMKKKIKEYKGIASGIREEIEATGDESHKQVLIKSLDTLRDEYFGDTFKIFKKRATEDMELDLTRFTKEYKKKFDTRLEDFYEYVIKL
jgi:hypothetical protein